MTTMRTLSCILLLAITVAAVVVLLDVPATPVTGASNAPSLPICGEWVRPGEAFPAGCELAPSTQSGSISAPPRAR